MTFCQVSQILLDRDHETLGECTILTAVVPVIHVSFSGYRPVTHWTHIFLWRLSTTSMIWTISVRRSRHARTNCDKRVCHNPVFAFNSPALQRVSPPGRNSGDQRRVCVRLFSLCFAGSASSLAESPLRLCLHLLCLVSFFVCVGCVFIRVIYPLN
ncbi:hypothetical protein B0H21DRAFT_581447 [Amylocystis lapponica]|nr:hypothetical protein B0H21DRAFT_581447 [Amylocystis lapponica]